MLLANMKRYIPIRLVSRTYSESNSISPISRKKLGGGKSSTDDQNSFDFNALIQRTLDEISRAVSHMKDLNETFEISLSDSQLVVNIGKRGCFTFRGSIESSRAQLNFISPVSGAFTYNFNANEQTWLDIHDNHDLRGLVTRDFIRVCVGCPKF